MSIVVELKNLTRNYPDIARAYEQSRQNAIAQAKAAWGINFGGFNASLVPNSFGEVPIRLSHLRLGTTNGTTDTWERSLTEGWNVTFNTTTQREVYLLINGWILPGATKYAKAMTQTSNGKQTPVVDFEGYINAFETPVVVYPEGTIVPQEAPYRLDVLASATGTQLLQPYGAAYVKVYRLVSLLNATV